MGQKVLNQARVVGFAVADFRNQRLGADSQTKIDRNYALGAGEELGEDPGRTVNHGTQYIRQYAGKRISGATAGLAYNLGLAPADINNAGVRNEDVGDGGAQNYDFTNRDDYNAGVRNLTKYIHHKLAGYDPVADGA